MNYGFLIDQRSCIGCHACTVACKSENEVPLGVFRTWVKYVEKGEFPNSRRHFLVERCNHCANAPCVEICPTQALFKRPDGIVDFDNSRCIGCKACMEACPYEAIYIDPASHTAAKCNFCAHRIDQGLQPACVVVCPEEAIVFGDLNDPTSRISQLIGRNSVQVRRPEQGTEPKLFYIGADEIALMPEALPHTTGAMWNEPTPEMLHNDTAHADTWMPHTDHAQVDYNIRHERPWGWMVSAYLVTKSFAAGLFLVLALLLTLGVVATGTLGIPAVVASLVFLGLTTVLLVADLKHPERFLYIIVKPHWSSWLVLGAWALIGYGGLLVIWLGLRLFASAPVPLPFTWLVAVFAALTAVYTAFLFGQAEGRDLWQGPLLPASLLTQAVMAGAAGLAIGSAATGAPAPVQRALALTLLVAVLVHGALILLELVMPHPTANAAWGIGALVHGEQAKLFWGVSVGIGIVAALVLLIAALAFPAISGLLITLAGIGAVAGLAGYEHAFVQAGQAAPLS